DTHSFILLIFVSSRRRHTRFSRDWSSDVCSSDLTDALGWCLSVRLLTLGRGRNFAFLSVKFFKRQEGKVDTQRQGRSYVAEQGRSEERRVGKECSAWSSGCHEVQTGSVRL